MEAEALRAKVAAATGVDADLLSGSSEEELRASAERLLAWRGAQVPKGAPATDAGVRGDEIRAARQLTREDLKKMSPAEIIKARQDGQLNNIMGLHRGLEDSHPRHRRCEGEGLQDRRGDCVRRH